ncbi:hypothetical protein H1S01_13460 [Heliobacterium chlorum]|uniref:Phage protein n=1 Tax=Heliobacterium chlorum TaxID=2698 RepID=A0ABR7T416_HELCL|nr:hypothetical protein [Heliobacterium chlorum]MBC9785509.1 hypothetical protein [Heliobacterium chlorum]
MVKYRIRTPNKIYNGVTEGVLFTNGEAIVDDERLKNILTLDYGYQSELIEEPKERKATKAVAE